MTNNDLLRKCVEGDNIAWDEFIRTYRKHVLRCVRHKLSILNIHTLVSLAEDITQDFFLKLWSSDRLSKVRDSRSIKGWLAISSMNFAVDSIKGRSNRNDQKTISLDMILDDEVEFDQKKYLNKKGIRKNIYTLCKDKFEEENPENKDMLKIIEKEISKFSAKQALVLKFNLLDGLTQKDIAHLMKIPQNTVSTIIKRGKSRLSKNLEQLEIRSSFLE